MLTVSKVLVLYFNPWGIRCNFAPLFERNSDFLKWKSGNNSLMFILLIYIFIISNLNNIIQELVIFYINPSISKSNKHYYFGLKVYWYYAIKYN